MKIWHQVAYPIATPLVAVIVFASMILAQDVPLEQKHIDDPVPLSQQAKTIPISSTLITLKITLDSGESVQATQCEGGMIRVEVEGGASILGLTPYLPNQGEDTVAVKVFRITRIKKGGKVVGEGITELETIEASSQSARAASKLANTDPRITIQLVNIRKGSKFKDTVMPRQDGASPIEEVGGTCCVTCNGVRTCACAVSASCGGCCMGLCCN